jgi:hypothetical protein
VEAPRCPLNKVYLVDIQCHTGEMNVGNVLNYLNIVAYVTLRGKKNGIRF